MKKRGTPDTSLSTSSYDTALTSTSKQRGAKAPRQSTGRSGSNVRRPPGKEFGSQSERSTSASATKGRAEKKATSRRDPEHDRDAARSEPERRSPPGAEFLAQTALQAGATSPFSVHSATSDERRPHEESEKKDEAEPKTQHSRVAVASSVARATGSKDKRPLRSKLLFACVAIGSVVLLGFVSYAAVEHWWNRGRPVVKGLFGAVSGDKLVVSDQGREWTVHAFLRVPFAKAPRGALRFKPPQPLDSPVGEDESGSTVDSAIKGPPCPQQDFYLGRQRVDVSNGSEDCLHLNIWSPALNCSTELDPCEARTVLFFLYGAAFQNGGNNFEASAAYHAAAQLYDGRYLSALGDLVVVVPNYRVGAMGFLSGPSPNTLPGNVGLHDQRLALSWTLTNIEHFGGNASRVVLAGHDAGATSLGYHLLNGDSGFWTRNVARYKSDGAEGAIRLATSLQCPADLVTEASMQCLQKASADAVARSQMAPRFAPVFNRPPLTRPRIRQAPDKSASSKVMGPQGKQFLVGRVEREGAYPWFLEQQRSGIGDSLQLATRLVGYELLERWQNATGIVLDATTGDSTYQEAVGDVLESCPMSELAEQLHVWKNRVHAYVLGYRPTYSGWTEENEAVHFEDMELVFGTPLRPDSPSSEIDKYWSRAMIRVWSTFAHTGRTPILKATKWPEYDTLRRTTMKLGPKEVIGQRDPIWQRCRALRDSGAVPSSP
ncbi:hypothetical protein MTO96_048449 [Rhipicephalus appendiculatus]